MSSDRHYNVKVTSKKENFSKVFSVPIDKTILEAVNGIGQYIPYSCRAGQCSSCLGKVHAGTVDQSTQMFLPEKAISAGYALMCSSFATSDVDVSVDVEDEYFSDPAVWK